MVYTKLIIHFCLLFCMIQCSGQKKTRQSTSAKSTIEKIELQEMTRGSSRMVEISPTSKTININGKVQNLRLSTAEWDEVIKSVSTFELKALNTFPAPTTDRYFDGALTATVRIYQNGMVYESQSFDSGNPPSQIKALYQLLSAPWRKNK